MPINGQFQTGRYVEKAIVHCSIKPSNSAVRRELKRHGMRVSHDTKPIAAISMRFGALPNGSEMDGECEDRIGETLVRVSYY